MEKDLSVKFYITAFITILLALAFVSVIATQTNSTTEKSSVVDESFNLLTLGCYVGGQVNTSDSDCTVTLANAPTSWETEDCPLTNVVVTNNTGTALTLTTDYTVSASTGTIAFKNTTATVNTSLGNIAKVDYTYCGDGYVNSSWGRTILGVNVGIFAIAILLIAVFLVYQLLGKKRDDD